MLLLEKLWKSKSKTSIYLSKYVDFSEICRVFGTINRMIDGSGICVMEHVWLQLTLNESTGPRQFDISNMDSFQPTTDLKLFLWARYKRPQTLQESD